VGILFPALYIVSPKPIALAAILTAHELPFNIEGIETTATSLNFLFRDAG
jgi:hypothetical protein